MKTKMNNEKLKQRFLRLRKNRTRCRALKRFRYLLRRWKLFQQG